VTGPATDPGAGRWEAYALRYATSQTPRRTRFHRYDARFDDGDASQQMDFYFWLLRDGESIVLIDCGFDPEQTAFPSYQVSVHPLELLERLNVAPEDVDHVVLTHMHFDHVGNVGLFPNARFTMGRAELDFWTGPLGRKPDVGTGGLDEEIAAVQALAQAGRLDLVEEATEIRPGVVVRPFRGHTPGLLMTEVASRGGPLLLASDAAHFYEEFEADLPFWLFTDLEGMYAGYAHLRELAAAGTRVVAGHDADDVRRYASVADDCLDLTQPLHL
jgi:glyoxylase-like metal-dependent hydrolase (beta-lactamase superfamily II)